MADQLNDDQKALVEIAQIIEAVDNRAMACDGPIPTTMETITQEEMSRIYNLACRRRAVAGMLTGTGASEPQQQIIPIPLPVETAARVLQVACHKRSVAAGWWNCPITGQPSTPEYIQQTMVPQKLLLIHSEISEACEAHRKGAKDSHLPHRDGVEVELADAMIRILDLAGGLRLDLGAAMAEKMAYNAQRADHKLAARMADGGKRY